MKKQNVIIVANIHRLRAGRLSNLKGRVVCGADYPYIPLHLPLVPVVKVTNCRRSRVLLNTGKHREPQKTIGNHRKAPENSKRNTRKHLKIARKHVESKYIRYNPQEDTYRHSKNSCKSQENTHYSRESTAIHRKTARKHVER